MKEKEFLELSKGLVESKVNRDELYEEYNKLSDEDKKTLIEYNYNDLNIFSVSCLYGNLHYIKFFISEADRLKIDKKSMITSSFNLASRYNSTGKYLSMVKKYLNIFQDSLQENDKNLIADNFSHHLTNLIYLIMDNAIQDNIQLDAINLRNYFQTACCYNMFGTIGLLLKAYPYLEKEDIWQRVYKKTIGHWIQLTKVLNEELGYDTTDIIKGFQTLKLTAEQATAEITKFKNTVIWLCKQQNNNGNITFEDFRKAVKQYKTLKISQINDNNDSWFSRLPEEVKAKIAEEHLGINYNDFAKTTKRSKKDNEDSRLLKYNEDRLLTKKFSRNSPCTLI